MKLPKKTDALPENYRGREQTYIKHIILDRYLERAARNVLWSQSDFVFVDGFSGPWASRTSGHADTSFGIAMRKLRHVRDELRARHGKERKVRCVFVEKHANAYARLSQAVKDAPYIDAVAIQGRFEDCVDNVRQHVGRAFALISIDPKGWSFDLQKLGPILRHRPSEVIVTFMYEFVNRFLNDKRTEIRRSYNLPFGDLKWRERFDALLAEGKTREEAVIETFREQLKKVGEYTYVLSARIQRPLAERSHFYLFYGTRHRKGLIEFRKVEKEAMVAQESARIEAKHALRKTKTGLDTLFSATELSVPRSAQRLRQSELERAKGWMRQQLTHLRSSGYTALMASALERFSMIEPEFKDILMTLRTEGDVVFEGMNQRQRKPDDNVIIVWVGPQS